MSKGPMHQRHGTGRLNMPFVGIPSFLRAAICTNRRVRARSKTKSPPKKFCGCKRPRSKLASVTVGKWPRP